MTTFQVVWFWAWLALVAFFLLNPKTRPDMVKPHWSPLEFSAVLVIYVISEKCFPTWSRATSLQIFLEIVICASIVVIMMAGIVFQSRWWNPPTLREDEECDHK